jgi:hypothetical protein
VFEIAKLGAISVLSINLNFVPFHGMVLNVKQLQNGFFKEIDLLALPSDIQTNTILKHFTHCDSNCRPPRLQACILPTWPC